MQKRTLVYVARQTVISQYTCGPTAAKLGAAPPRLDFLFFSAISPWGLLTARCHTEHAETRIIQRLLTLMLILQTTYSIKEQIHYIYISIVLRYSLNNSLTKS